VKPKLETAEKILDRIRARNPEYKAPGNNGKHKTIDPVELLKAFTFLADAPASPPHMLIKGLLPAQGVAVTGGQSTAGKTFSEIHKAICLARPLPFFRCKIVERVGTAFVAAEGRALIPNRFAAALAKYSITEELPMLRSISFQTLHHLKASNYLFSS
jgi:hypothetical protein